MTTFRPGPDPKSKPPVKIFVAYSPDDGGFYSEIIGSIGQTLHTTELADDQAMAIADARKWIIVNRYREINFSDCT